MKALTVRQPWASAIFDDNPAWRKIVENRSKPTRYRGRLAIHARLTYTTPNEKPDPISRRIRRQAMRDPSVPRGFVLGTVELVDCVDDANLPETAQALAWAIEGQWHWIFANAQRFVEPIPATGQLGLWDWINPLEEIV